jgi:O-antigen/teichoic acid export membrane protein
MLSKSKIQARLYNYFNVGERNQVIVENVLNSLTVKILGTLATLSLISISINLVDKELYGVWLTISSTIIWFGIFDMGLSNGLRNKLSQAFTLQKDEEAAKYLSTTYAILFIIICPVWILFVSLSTQINWQRIFNTKLDNYTLVWALNIVFSSFCITFFLKPFSALLMAKQKHFQITLLQCIGNIMSLLIILMASLKNRPSFIFLSATLSLSYPAVLILASIIMYKKKYPTLKPAFKYIDFSKKKNLFEIGLKFFFIQLSVLLVYTSDNLIIAHLLGNQKVTEYNIVLRYFTVITIFHGLIMAPYWTACTQAIHLSDITWLKKTTKKINTVSWWLCACVLLMFLGSNIAYKLWLGSKVEISPYLSLLVALYVCIGLFKETYVTFINGIGRINLQLLVGVLGAILHLPLAYVLIKKTGLGLNGLIYLNIFWFLLAAILWRVQFSKILYSKTVKKIWN